ncbi:hypothetical protein QBC34DRAFT_151579 [Podospora aff. communis PSN243]|uniref:Uncharacterized protein n=1 Tax=Podospora aff. communis PSN243 TaxID=3040156 RepID=A0AAV9GD59_9PEZI|nr:hypothetical protein QBC34DRAFT_151579 [Podospora aff. communis PSN243]
MSVPLTLWIRKANCQQFDVYCFNCYRPGHFATSPERGRSSGKCSFPTRCGYCSEPHDTKYCPLRHTHVPINYHPQWKCPNCFGPHVAWSDECRAEDVSKMRQTLAKPGWGPAADKRADQYIAFLRASGQGPTNMDASQVAPQSTPPQPIQQPLAAPPPPFQPLAAPPPPIRPMASPPPVSRPVSPIMAVEPTAQSRAHLASPSTPRTRAPVVRIPPALEPGENSLRVIYDRLLDEQQTALDAIFLPHDLTQPKRQPGRGAKRKQGDDSGRDNTKKRRLPDYNLADDMKAEALRLATTMEHSNLGLAASALPPSLTPTPSPETLPPPTPTQHATGIAPSTPEMVPAPSQAPTVRAAGFKILNAVAEMLLLIASQNV